MTLHEHQPVLTAGEDLDDARAAAILIHGRGADAESILTLAPGLERPGLAFLAPQAAGGTWYPGRFLDPVESNEPWLSSALAAVGNVVGLVEETGIPAESILLLGFSQGACLVLEFLARNARRYGGVAGLSGSLIGPEGSPRPTTGSLEGGSATVAGGSATVDGGVSATTAAGGARSGGVGSGGGGSPGRSGTAGRTRFQPTRMRLGSSKTRPPKRVPRLASQIVGHCAASP